MAHVLWELGIFRAGGAWPRLGAAAPYGGTEQLANAAGWLLRCRPEFGIHALTRVFAVAAVFGLVVQVFQC